MREYARFLSILVFAVCAVSFATADAVPRYSARYRQNCNLCHHNPTGGGLRSLYASQYLVPAEMAVKQLDAKAREKIQPNLTESVTVGADLRTVFAATTDGPPGQDNFFQMQGDLYVKFQVLDRFSAYMDRGQSRSLEMFGLAYVLPFTGYVKTGRFTPEFGWKFADHNHYTRSVAFPEPPSHTDTGIEIGLYPGTWALQFAVLNGDPGGFAFDRNDILGYAGRALGRFDIGPLGLALGGSYWRNSEIGGRRTAGGPFGYVNVRDFSWLWEFDWSELDGPGVPPVTTLVTSHEISYQAQRGVYLLVTYDYQDRGRVANQGHRLGAGFDVMTTPFSGVRAAVNRFAGGKLAGSRGYLEYVAQLHLFY